MLSSLRICFLAFLTTVLASPLVPSRTTNHISHVRRDGTGSVTGSGLAWYTNSLTAGTKGFANPATYNCYSGPASNFPKFNQWMNFNDMFALQNRSALSKVNTAQNVNLIKNGILKISQASKVDPRVILAVIILESTGNVNVGCTTSFGGVKNCGLMQSYNPTDQSFDPSHPAYSINLMIQDGTQGTPSGPGLVQWFNHASDVSFNTAGNIYKVMRGYNSGSLNNTNLSDGRGANPAYVSNIANYLLGWQGYGVNANSSKCSNFVNNTPTPVMPTPTACQASRYIPPPTQTVSGTTPDCCKWYNVQSSSDNCDVIDKANNLTLTQFRALNTYINADCTNLFLNYAYCANGNPISSSSSAVAMAIQTPIPQSSSPSPVPAASSTAAASVSTISSGSIVSPTSTTTSFVTIRSSSTATSTSIRTRTRSSQTTSTPTPAPTS